jgi:hypothetical protein
MNIYSGFTIPTFGRHVTIFIVIKHAVRSLYTAAIFTYLTPVSYFSFWIILHLDLEYKYIVEWYEGR